MLLQPTRLLSVHEIFQAGRLECVAVSFSKALWGEVIFRGCWAALPCPDCPSPRSDHPSGLLCLWQETLRDEMSSRSRLASLVTESSGFPSSASFDGDAHPLCAQRPFRPLGLGGRGTSTHTDAHAACWAVSRAVFCLWPRNLLYLPLLRTATG